MMMMMMMMIMTMTVAATMSIVVRTVTTLTTTDYIFLEREEPLILMNIREARPVTILNCVMMQLHYRFKDTDCCIPFTRK
jgi:hypothetical protein